MVFPPKNNSAPQNLIFRIGSSHCTVGTMTSEEENKKETFKQLNPVFEETRLVLLSTVGPRTIHLCISGGGPWPGPAHASNCLLNPEIWLGSSAQDKAVLSWWLSKITTILPSRQFLLLNENLRPKVFSGALSVSYNQKETSTYFLV